MGAACGLSITAVLLLARGSIASLVSSCDAAGAAGAPAVHLLVWALG